MLTTPYGLAVLRYDKMSRLIKSPKGCARAAWHGRTTGSLTGRSRAGGPAGCSTRRARSTTGSAGLMNPAFSPKLIGGLVPGSRPWPQARERLP
ncbi:MAG: hypothetical protein R2734_16510 [Nocardioides sp.]